MRTDGGSTGRDARAGSARVGIVGVLAVFLGWVGVVAWTASSPPSRPTPRASTGRSPATVRPQADATVVARRYRRRTADAAGDYARGGAYWVEELFLPDAGVVANVTWREATTVDPDGAATVATAAVLNAWFQDAPGNRYPISAADGDRIVTPLEDVRIPRDLADAIVAEARARRESEDRRRTLGARAAAAGVLRRLDAGGDVAPPAPPAAPRR